MTFNLKVSRETIFSFKCEDESVHVRTILSGGCVAFQESGDMIMKVEGGEITQDQFDQTKIKVTGDSPGVISFNLKSGELSSNISYNAGTFEDPVWNLFDRETRMEEFRNCLSRADEMFFKIIPDRSYMEKEQEDKELLQIRVVDLTKKNEALTSELKKYQRSVRKNQLYEKKISDLEYSSVLDNEDFEKKKKEMEKKFKSKNSKLVKRKSKLQNEVKKMKSEKQQNEKLIDEEKYATNERIKNLEQKFEEEKERLRFDLKKMFQEGIATIQKKTEKKLKLKDEEWERKMEKKDEEWERKLDTTKTEMKKKDEEWERKMEKKDEEWERKMEKKDEEWERKLDTMKMEMKMEMKKKDEEWERKMDTMKMEMKEERKKMIQEFGRISTEKNGRITETLAMFSFVQNEFCQRLEEKIKDLELAISEMKKKK